MLLSLKSIVSMFASGITFNGTLPDDLSCAFVTIALPGNKIREKLLSKFKCKGNSSLTYLNLQNNMLDGDIPSIFYCCNFDVREFDKEQFYIN